MFLAQGLQLQLGLKLGFLLRLLGGGDLLPQLGDRLKMALGPICLLRQLPPKVLQVGTQLLSSDLRRVPGIA